MPRKPKNNPPKTEQKEAPSSPTDAPVKRPPWRPTEYKEEYCEKIIELGRRGLGIEASACEIGVLDKTLDDWARRYPSFSDAFALAKLESMRWWENLAQNHMIESKDGNRLNTGAWSRSMAARFPKKYREQPQEKPPLQPVTIIKTSGTTSITQGSIDDAGTPDAGSNT